LLRLVEPEKVSAPRKKIALPWEENECNFAKFVISLITNIAIFEKEHALAQEKLEIFEMENVICEEFNPAGLNDEQSAFFIKRSIFLHEDFFRGDYKDKLDGNL
jgi:hypothetical protein